MASGDIQHRVAQLRAEHKKEQGDQEYPGVGEVYVATIRIQPDGHVKIYPEGEKKPLLSLYRQAAKLNTQSTQFEHGPEQTSFGQYSINPMARDLPSTNTITVQSFIPTIPDFVMVASIARAVADYVNESGSRESRNKTEVNIVPTEYIDYEDLVKD
jgi:hypothetical protein